MKIIGVGDIMPGGILNGTDKAFISEDLLSVLRSGDIRVGTLETAIGDKPSFYDEKMKRKADVIYAMDKDMKRLVDMGIDIVSLANNHFFDLGPAGAEHTVSLLDSLGIKHCGAGRNIEEASAPAYATVNGKTVAFLAFCDFREITTGWCPFASENAPGVNPLKDDYVISEIKKYRSSCDYLVVLPHWGIEYWQSPAHFVYKLSKKMIKAGADLVLGSHPHCIQPVMKFRGKHIIFSMGNFLFPDRLLAPPRSTYYSEIPINTADLPVTDGYPKHVESITYKIWKKLARYGMIASVELNGQSQFLQTEYNHLTTDNALEKIHFSDVEKYRKLKREQAIVNSGLYTTIDFAKRLRNTILGRAYNLTTK